MNRGAECVINSMAAADFYENRWAEVVVVENVAKQDLTPKSRSPDPEVLHVALMLPRLKAITDPQHLLTQQEVNDPMSMDLNQIATDTAAMLAMADAQTLPAFVVSEPNWSSKEAVRNKRLFDSYLKDRPEYIKNDYTYKASSPLGIPSLTYRLPIEYNTYPGPMPKDMPGERVYLQTKSGVRYVNPNYVSLASSACFLLDYELTRALGSWGPECKITKFLSMPTNGKLIKQPGDDQYTYTPKKPRTKDFVRFILENGAGKQVDVTVDLSTGADSTDYSVGSNNADQSIE